MRRVRDGPDGHRRAFKLVLPRSDRNVMSDQPTQSPESRVALIVQRMLTERSIHRTVGLEDDIRDAGLTSLDIINLVFAVEAEFDLMIPESGITPNNFRSVLAISRLITTLQDAGT